MDATAICRRNTSGEAEIYNSMVRLDHRFARDLQAFFVSVPKESTVADVHLQKKVRYDQVKKSLIVNRGSQILMRRALFIYNFFVLFGTQHKILK